ncbi:TonB-dependent receptor [Flavobacterium amniphilum]|uniref:TonB-dependent receptor domain-containing protein n=1 Tax=Flavobacterium amniphilum TaxID=1834035 RepID=UPI00202A8BC3|nr:TonB-dependent receptor [Flavobacterium amniphilum]MCL9807087.1 TonB-dependent receptor [Flavobacterium amniphilum]
MNRIKIYTSFIVILAAFQTVSAQKKDENIGTEVVNVVKPYTPTISDAYKVKEVPVIEDQETTKKEEVKYQIFSFPVASTFVPAKGKAAAVDKAKQEKLYPNYATLGFGNYKTILGELFISHEIDKFQYAGGMFRHQSSQGGIDGVKLDDAFGETSINAMYGYNRNETSFKVDLGYKYEGYNWYGAPLENPNFDEANLNVIDPGHTYNTLTIGSELAVTKSFFDKVNLNFIGFSDNYGSRENRFIIKPAFNFDFNDTAVKLKFGLDYLNSSFETIYNLETPAPDVATNIEKSNLIFSANPSFTILKDDLSIELGAEVTYFSRMKDIYNGVETDLNNEFYIFPKIKASYNLVKDIMVFFAGAEGGLRQNSYESFAGQNKFLSPTLLLEPTNNQFNIYAGLKGKLANTVAYNLKAGYDSTENMPLFKSNPYLSDPTDNYSYGNSFSVVYDNVKTISFGGELKADVNKNVTIGINAQVYSYDTKDQEEAWNMPTVKAGFTTDFNIGKKWYAGSQLFYVGERFDAFTNYQSFPNPDSKQKLESYFDINAHVGYKHNERLTVFLKGNNLANQNYQKWLNYPVQGAQAILGASYKFDF